MNALTNFDFGGGLIRVVQEESGEPWFVGKDVAQALGYADHTSAMKQHCRGVVKHHPIADALGRMQEARVISESDMMRLVVNSKLPSAERFERWVFEDVLPSIRKTGGYAMKSSNPLAIESVQMAGAIADAMHLPDSGRLGLVQKAVQLHAPQHMGLLPSYAVDAPAGATAGSSEVTASLSELLRERGVKISAVKANQLLADAGLIERLSRPSTKGGGEKQFWSVTRKGEAYAKNLSSPNNPRETQPHWFVSRFADVIELLEREQAPA